MNRTAAAIAVGLALAAALPAAPAQAQNARSFVSGHGLDSNACTLAAPCRTFAVAFANTNAGGEIDVLDTAGYGALTITHAISIVNDGAIASILVPSGGTGITINAAASDAVSLRGLTIEGSGAANSVGIAFNSGQSLEVNHCVIYHLRAGISFQPNASSSLFPSETLVSGNYQNGIEIIPGGSGAVMASIDRVEATNNNAGITAQGHASTGTINVTVTNSVAAGNVSVGINAQTTSAPTAVMVRNSSVVNNGYGIWAFLNSTAIIRIAQSTITGNTTAWAASNSAQVLSYGDNNIDGNGCCETAPPSIVRK